MIAVLGLKIDEVKNLLMSKNSASLVKLLNDNVEGQVILSGENAVDLFKDKLKEKNKSMSSYKHVIVVH